MKILVIILGIFLLSSAMALNTTSGDNQTICSTELSGVFDHSIDFTKVVVGSCENLQITKYFLNYEEEEGIYSFRGLKIYAVVLVLLILFLIFLFGLTNENNKLSDKVGENHV